MRRRRSTPAHPSGDHTTSRARFDDNQICMTVTRQLSLPPSLCAELFNGNRGTRIGSLLSPFYWAMNRGYVRVATCLSLHSPWYAKRCTCSDDHKLETTVFARITSPVRGILISPNFASWFGAVRQFSKWPNCIYDCRIDSVYFSSLIARDDICDRLFGYFGY